MNSPDQHAEQIFAAALEISDASERHAYVERACSGDVQLRAEVESLLASHEQAGEFLKTELSDSASALSVPVTEASGARIGRYKLLEQIGEGGFGVVWMAEQEEPVRRRVALKIIKLGMDTREVVARFEAERQALALMDHPNIARVFDGGATESGRPYFVMELVRGEPITKYCDEQRLSLEERLELFVQVCQAVQHAHQKGVIHRDLKPSNILVAIHDDKPVPKVIDFGIAKATQQRLTEKTLFTRFNQFVGTPAYMSPEQAGLSSLDIDTRSDIYSLGVLLYELLTGRTPFSKEELFAGGYEEICRIIREKEPPKPSTRLSTMSDNDRSTIAAARKIAPEKLGRLVRGELDWVVMKALEKDRTSRYESATAFAQDIERFLHQEPVGAVGPSLGYRFRKFARRNRIASATASMISLALLTAVIISTWQAVRATQAKHEATAALAQEARARERAVRGELLARQNAYASDMNLAFEALQANNLGRTLELLNGNRPALDEKDLRGWEWRYLWANCQSDALFTLGQHSDSVTTLAFPGDSQTLISAGVDGLTKQWDLGVTRTITTLDRRGGISPLRLFGCRHLFASRNGRGGIRIWEIHSGKTIAEFAQQFDIRSMAFSPDEKKAAAFVCNRQVIIWNLESKRTIATFPAGDCFAVHQGVVTFSPDGGLFAFGDMDGRIRFIDIAHAEEKLNFPAHPQAITALSFSPGGEIIASGCGFSDNAIKLWEVKSGRQIGRLEGHTSLITSLVFSPDGRTLVSSSDDQTIRLWDLASQQQLRVLRGHLDEVWTLALSPDGETLASGSKDGTICIWSAALKPKQESFVVLPSQVKDLTFYPQGKGFVTSNGDGSVSIWDDAFLKETSRIDELGTNNFCIATSPDGHWLVAGTLSGTVKVWDLVAKRAVTNLLAEGVIPDKLKFLSKSKRLLALSFNGRVKLLDTISWREVTSVNNIHSEYGAAISPDERRLATGNPDGTITLSNLPSAQEEKRFKAHKTMVRGLAFTPDGRMLASVSQDGTVKLWDLLAGHEAGSWRAHLNGVFAVAISPDGQRLATASGGKEAAKLWDLTTKREVATLQGQGSLIEFMAFSPDGSILVAINHEGIAHIWRAPSFSAIEATEQVRTATLSH